MKEANLESSDELYDFTPESAEDYIPDTTCESESPYLYDSTKPDNMAFDRHILTSVPSLSQNMNYGIVVIVCQKRGGEFQN